MDFTLSMAAWAMDMKAQQFMQSYEFGLQRKIMDAESSALEGVLEMMPQQADIVPKGDLIDVFA